MDGILLGVFGSDSELKQKFESAVAKKSEAEGISLYHRVEGGRRFSLLDTDDFPDRIQGYARIASIADHALYVFPGSGRLSPADGELAIMLQALGVPGTLELIDGAVSPEAAAQQLRGTLVSSYRVEERSVSDAAIDLSGTLPIGSAPPAGTLVYIDRVFTVKGVGTVALGFVLAGKVSIHDQLHPIPGPPESAVDVKGIQVNDVDFDSAGRGVRVGLSLRGMDPKELGRSHWLSDGPIQAGTSLALEFSKSPFYRAAVDSRELHLSIAGEVLPANLSAGPDGLLTASLASQAPVWEGMKTAVIDLNAKSLRVAGGGSCKL